MGERARAGIRVRRPVAVLVAAAGMAVCVVPSGAALATPTRAPRLVVAFTGDRGAPSKAARHSLRHLELKLVRPVFKGHEDWNIWEVGSRGTGARGAPVVTEAACVCGTKQKLFHSSA